MKVVHCSNGISTSSAVTKLHRALLKQGVDSRVLTLSNKDGIENVRELSFYGAARVCHSLHARITSKLVYQRYDMNKGVPFWLGNVGYNITGDEWIKEADIIHLHWVSGNFLSFKNINQLLKLNKPIVWTLHDSWPLTGGCHVRLGCERFRKGCGECPVLKSDDAHDVSYQVMKAKKRLFLKQNLIFIAPSTWMYENIKSSTIFNEIMAYHIPNGLDTTIFKKYEKNEVETNLEYIQTGKINILFGATAALETVYKGYNFLKEALLIIKKNHSEIAQKIVLHFFGCDSVEDEELSTFQVKCWGTVKDPKRLAYIYNLADLYAFPSIDDNLPSTVMESLACATPLVTFETGGIPDMVIHKENGYVAKYKDVEDFARGILWTLEHNTHNELGGYGEEFVETHYNEALITRQHIELYNHLKDNL